MSAPPIQAPKKLKISRTQTLKAALLPLSFIGFGLLNGAAENPVLVIVAIVCGCLACAHPYPLYQSTRIKRALRLVLGALVFAFFSLLAQPAQAQFFQSAETFFTLAFALFKGKNARSSQD
jgi:hypothetical protein